MPPAGAGPRILQDTGARKPAPPLQDSAPHAPWAHAPTATVSSPACRRAALAGRRRESRSRLAAASLLLMLSTSITEVEGGRLRGGVGEEDVEGVNEEDHVVGWEGVGELHGRLQLLEQATPGNSPSQDGEPHSLSRSRFQGHAKTLVASVMRCVSDGVILFRPGRRNNDKGCFLSQHRRAEPSG